MLHSFLRWRYKAKKRYHNLKKNNHANPKCGTFYRKIDLDASKIPKSFTKG